MQKPSIPKGTRDFGPSEMVKRNYIFDSIKSVFQLYGYLPIETPAMENLDTLLGKYGEEGDKLLFKILNSGDYLKSTTDVDFEKKELNALALKLCEKGLRYDLTVPFARFVVQHQNEITFPFKRYQIQPVWRADRPQKGRYREFYQCDADVIGSDSLLNEVELISIIDTVFNRLGISTTIKVNNRKILAGIAEYLQANHLLTDITVAIDKIDKIGLEAVNAELESKGLSGDAIKKLQPVLLLKGSNQEKLAQLQTILSGSQTGLKGIEEVNTIFSFLSHAPVETPIELDLTLARGLNYYTGAIFEVKANDVSIGSICGGGRYDDLTGIFGLKDISGVGISFGADRIYDVMNQLNIFPAETTAGTQVMLVNFGEAEQNYCLKAIKLLRDSNISAELYPESAKLKKQLSYANDKQIPWVLLAGQKEIETGRLTLKNMALGEQYELSLNEIVSKLVAES